MNTTFNPNAQSMSSMVVGLVGQVRRMFTAEAGCDNKQTRCTVLVQLLRASRLITQEQLAEVEKQSKTTGLSVTDCLMACGWISKDLLETAQTMQIQIETGELAAVEAHAVLLRQKNLHDAHVRADFFMPRHDICLTLPSELESFMDEIFNQLPPVAMQPMVVAPPQLTAAQKAAYASRMWQ